MYIPDRNGKFPSSRIAKDSSTAKFQQSSIKRDCSWCLPYSETISGVTHDTFCLEGEKLQSRKLLISGDSCAAIKRDKVDLMVKHSTIERKVDLHRHAASGCADVTMRMGQKAENKQTQMIDSSPRIGAFFI